MALLITLLLDPRKLLDRTNVKIISEVVNDPT